MAKYDESYKIDSADELEDETAQERVNRVFKEHHHDYIEKLEELGFTYHDDEFDEEEHEEAIAKPENENQIYLVSFFNGETSLCDRTLEVFLLERRSPSPNYPLIRRYFKQGNKHLLSLLSAGLNRFPVNEELLSDLAYFHEHHNVLELLIQSYLTACECQENQQVFTELVLDFHYAVVRDGYDVFYALKERYSVESNNRKVIDFLEASVDIDDFDIEF